MASAMMRAGLRATVASAGQDSASRTGVWGAPICAAARSAAVSGQRLVTPSRTKRSARGAIATQALFGGLQKAIQGDPAEKTRKKYEGRVAKINDMGPAMKVNAEPSSSPTSSLGTWLAIGRTPWPESAS